MRFPDQERFAAHCVAKRRAYLRLLRRRGSPASFFEVWRAEFGLANQRFDVGGLLRDRQAILGLQYRWLLLQDLMQVIRAVVPDLLPPPPPVLRALPNALRQAQSARSMLLTGPRGTGREAMAVLLHVLTGRPGAMVELDAGELGGETPTRQMMPERGTVYIADLEHLPPRGQDELIAFLNGEARRRDLLFVVATGEAPDVLSEREDFRRDLIVRVSQTVTKLSPLDPSSDDSGQFAGDVVYDLIRVHPDRLTRLRAKAESLAGKWREEAEATGRPTDHDFEAEASSYVQWQERKQLALSVLGQQWCQRVVREPGPHHFGGLADRLADGLSRSVASSGPRDEPSESSRSLPAAPAQIPTDLSRDQLLRLYYESLLTEEDGDATRVASRAGLDSDACMADLRRLDLMPTSADEPDEGTRDDSDEAPAEP